MLERLAQSTRDLRFRIVAGAVLQMCGTMRAVSDRLLDEPLGSGSKDAPVVGETRGVSRLDYPAQCGARQFGQSRPYATTVSA